MKVVGIGGGTGLPVLLGGLKELNETGEDLIDTTAIVAVSDDGGSTGALRRAIGMPAMGDIRNCLVALAAEDSLLASVCQHRFESLDGFAGHPVGNLILSALYEMSGDFAGAVDQASNLLRLKGRVLPSTEIPLTLCAQYEDGATVDGESKIGEGTSVGAVSDRPRSMIGTSSAVRGRPPRKIIRVWLDPPDPPAAPGVIEALEKADAIVIGPGSLYTSIIPNLLVAGVSEAIHSSRAIKIYVCNLMTQRGETEGYSAADHLRAVETYLPPGSIDVCVLNTQVLGTGLAERYSEFRSEIVSGTSESVDEIRRLGVVPAAAPLLKFGEMKARHDPTILARLVVSTARGFTGVSEIICGQWNGR